MRALPRPRPVLENLEREYAGRFRLAKVNLDENPELAEAFGVRPIPAVFGLRDGEAVAQFLGAQPEAQVREFIALRAAIGFARAARGSEEELKAKLSAEPSDGEARGELLHAFTLAADQPELVAEFRRMLATLLY